MKKYIREHKILFWLLTGVLLVVVLVVFNMYRPRDIRISGQIESIQEKQAIDLRLMFFDTEDGAIVLRTVEYDEVMY